MRADQPQCPPRAAAFVEEDQIPDKKDERGLERIESIEGLGCVGRVRVGPGQIVKEPGLRPGRRPQEKAMMKKQLMRITSCKNVNVEEWDAVAAALGGGYFHCHAEATYHATSTGTEPIYLQAMDDSGNCVGVTSGTVAKSHVWPFSSYCGYAMLLCVPAVADQSEETQTAVMAAMEDHLRRKGIFCVRVYSYDSLTSEGVLSSLGYDLSPRSEFCVDLTRSLDEIWQGFKGERRTDVRKAEKLGVVTRLENTQEALAMLSVFKAQSMERRGVSASPGTEASAAERSRLETGKVDIFVSYQDETPVNASLFGFFNSRAYYHVSGSSDAGYKCCGPAHVIWTAIKAYKERGATILNLGATLEGQTGLQKFKRCFGSTVFSAPIGKKGISRVGSGLNWVRSRLRGQRG